MQMRQESVSQLTPCSLKIQKGTYHLRNVTVKARSHNNLMITLLGEQISHYNTIL